LTDLRFVRRADGLTYDFVRDADAYGFPSYRRVDLDLWCRRLPNFGWAVCTSSGEVVSRPFDDPGDGDLPPEGVWVSRTGDRTYVYELIRAETTQAINR
jgi:hypothetical protein